jgi:hypothetical protein
MKPILLTFALITLVIVGVQGADASPITIGESVVYNFNFTGQTPGPPYGTYVYLDYEVNNLVPSPGSVATIDIFTGLNASGSLYFSGDLAFLSGLSFPSIINMSDPGVLDGVFSIRWTVKSGEFEILDTLALAYNGDPLSNGPVARVPGTVSSVPEPSTLATLGTGLIAFLAFTRRRVPRLR